MKSNDSVLILNFILTNIIRGYMLALMVAATEFFVNEIHIGEKAFFVWMLIGTAASFLLKFLEAIEIYYKLKEMNNGN